MVLGRRRFTWRADLRGVATVTMLGLVTFAAATALIALVLVLARQLSA
jgi:hypothetical protein